MSRDRSTYIGSGDISTILGLNPWQTKLQLYEAKINGTQKEDTESMKWGRLLEPVIINEFCRQRSIPAYREQIFAEHPDYDFIAGTADALTALSLIEAKTTNEFSHRKWKEELPEYIQIQTQFLMGIHHKKAANIIVLVAGQKLRVYELEFDEEVYELLIHNAVNFWRTYIETRTPPEEK